MSAPTTRNPKLEEMLSRKSVTPAEGMGTVRALVDTAMQIIAKVGSHYPDRGSADSALAALLIARNRLLDAERLQ